MELAGNRGEDYETLKQTVFERLNELVFTILSAIPASDVMSQKSKNDLMGWDIIFDSDLHPWLMKFNRFPDLAPDKSSFAHSEIVNSALEVSLMRNIDLPIRVSYQGWQKVVKPK